MVFYTEEQIRQAKSVDLLSYLQRTDPSQLVRVSGNTFCLREHDSFRISNGKWYWFSRGMGGVSAVDFLVRVRGLSFIQAISAVLENRGYPAPNYLKITPRRLLLPAKNQTADKVKAYLRKRCIDPEIIQYCLERNTLYESKDEQNAVFVGYDEIGKPRHAALRGLESDYKSDASGSDKNYSFRIKGVVGNPHLHVFESAIDLLSYATLVKQRGCDWTRESLLSLAGVYVVKREGVIPIALEHFLKTYPDVKIIHLHLDNDEVGRSAAEGIKRGLRGKYPVWNQPPRRGKDMNEYLQERSKERWKRKAKASK